jgi:hypothetical protein
MIIRRNRDCNGWGPDTVAIKICGSQRNEKCMSVRGVTAGTRRGKGVNFSVTRVVINYP